MVAKAGKLNSRLELERREDGTDAWGAPSRNWIQLGTFSGNVKNDTGLGAIRTAGAAGVPASIAKYSIEVRSEVIRRYNIGPADRLIGRLPFNLSPVVMSVTGIINDFADPTHAYILAEVGANET